MARIALIGENSVEYIDRLIDIWNKGDCAVLLDWRIPLTTACDMMCRVGVEYCFIDSALADGFCYEEYSDIVFSPYENKTKSATRLPAEIYDKFRENYAKREAVIFYSSGTTGRSRGIILTHYAVQANADAIQDYMLADSNDCMYIVKALSHSSTLTGELLVALKKKIPLVVAPTIVPPRYVFHAITHFCITIICLNPTLVQLYAKEYRKEKYNLNTLKTMYVSGAPFREKICKDIHAAFRDIQIYNVYGLSEAGPRVAAQRKGRCVGDSVGIPIKGVEVIVLDGDKQAVPKGESGIIYVKTPYHCIGYASGEKKLSFYNEDWLCTGDLGYWDECDELHVIGRADDVIIVDAHKVYPWDVEKVIIENTFIEECIVARIERENDELIGCLYLGSREFFACDFKKLRGILPHYEIPKYFMRVGNLPVNKNGKPSRTEASTILAGGKRRKDVRNGNS